MPLTMAGGVAVVVLGVGHYERRAAEGDPRREADRHFGVFGT
jgi:hypothetical protein